MPPMLTIREETSDCLARRALFSFALTFNRQAGAADLRIKPHDGEQRPGATLLFPACR